MTLIERLLRRIEIDPLSECWIWTGARQKVNSRDDMHYGRIGRDGGQAAGTEYTHRAAYLFWVGPIGPGLEIDHRCRVTLCCNPDHLEAVTHGVNQQRGGEVKRRIVCVKGHLMVGDNAKRERNYVTCRTCHNERNRLYARRKKQNNIGDQLHSDPVISTLE